ncbi:hypothetical protein BDY17DRAFT_133115 [Neohortaea acidophila]|uniref:Secreted protein n=1 Tax=Neohortaea acidophila TaxID=245834 RepID=A0A6A6PYY7_9PEZI|nr:uncharacterized protein BDY17DRAFT_133115 [Neohortaea acidophila]KAF2484663.1 hypothetical protein BDY17DRAFT_133115 [Neohortaea acidophila]
MGSEWLLFALSRVVVVSNPCLWASGRRRLLQMPARSKQGGYVGLRDCCCCVNDVRTHPSPLELTKLTLRGYLRVSHPLYAIRQAKKEQEMVKMTGNTWICFLNIPRPRQTKWESVVRWKRQKRKWRVLFFRGSRTLWLPTDRLWTPQDL